MRDARARALIVAMQFKGNHAASERALKCLACPACAEE